MRFFYLMLKITLQYATRIFYPRQKMLNTPKELYGRTIYVSNHAASFMDPLIVAGMRRPIVFFMTRSDVFTPLTKPILWAAHMFPIYRQHDGEDTKAKNEEIFKKCTRVLSFGRNLLIFGEGFTDDVFIRRLKPVKKGAARIGFTSLEELNWSKKIYMAAVGVNYSEPNRMLSDVLVSTSDKFCLNDYREMYEENPSKAINEVTKRIEKLMQDQITHIENKDLANFHESVMQLTRKGMNAVSYDRSISLVDRYKYSQKLANWLNQQSPEENTSLSNLKEKVDAYFQLLKRSKTEEEYVYRVAENKLNNTLNYIYLVLVFPFMILGLIHCGIPYILIKRMVEKTFKRRVFWGSVKLLLGKIIIGLVNIPAIFLFYHFIFPSYWLGFAYYLLIGLFGLAAYIWFIKLKDIRINNQLKNVNFDAFVSKRAELIEEIKSIIPIA